MNKTALVVDDSKSARFALRKFLEGFNYKVETAESANDAYRILAGTLPEVIFMDHIMPGTDGFEAMRVLKSDARTAAVPMVICSSNEGEEFVKQAKACGASDVLQKPPSPEQLAGVLANLTSHPAHYGSALPPQTENDLLAQSLAPGLQPRREQTAMERLMATIPPRMLPSAYRLPSLPADAMLNAPATEMPTLSPSTLTPLPAMAARPPASKVLPLREPAITIQQAVMKSIRDAMPQQDHETTEAPSAASSSLPVMPALAAGGDGIMATFRDDLDDRLSRLRQEFMSELTALRVQLAESGGSTLDEKLRTLANEAAKSRTNALASSLDQHLSALRSNLDAVLRAQNERIEQLLQNSRQVASDEAERTVMNAAQRISDQIAESILKTLGPELANMRRL